MENFWSFIKNINQTIKSLILVRIILISIILLLLLIPSSQVNRLINEREFRRQSVIDEINSKWAYSQTLLGPVLEIPYKVYHISKWIDKNGIEKKTVTREIKYTYFLPDILQINGDVIPEYRHRDIYSTVVYASDLAISGEYELPDFSQWKIPLKDIIWKDATFSFGLTDMRGINKTIDLTWNKNATILKPGAKENPLVTKGVFSQVNINKGKQTLIGIC